MVNAGLPNITGRRISWWGGADGGGRSSYSGCFASNPDNGVCPTVDGTNWWNDGNGNGFSFDASKSNSIYGSSDTVTPLTYTVRAYICYA